MQKLIIKIKIIYNKVIKKLQKNNKIIIFQ